MQPRGFYPRRQRGSYYSAGRGGDVAGGRKGFGGVSGFRDAGEFGGEDVRGRGRGRGRGQSSSWARGSSRGAGAISNYDEGEGNSKQQFSSVSYTTTTPPSSSSVSIVANNIKHYYYNNNNSNNSNNNNNSNSSSKSDYTPPVSFAAATASAGLVGAAGTRGYVARVSGASGYPGIVENMGSQYNSSRAGAATAPPVDRNPIVVQLSNGPTTNNTLPPGHRVANSSTSAPRFVVAIDFGTSHSGFAYAHRDDPDSIEAYYHWDSAPQPYAKTLSALLLSKSGFPEEWGFTANYKYMRLNPAMRPNYELVTRFKLHLDEKHRAENPNAISTKHSPVALIGYYLSFMRKLIADRLTIKFGDTFSLSQVKWCLTVPAMWSEAAKRMMRKAAAFAGLVDEPDSSRLAIILEPEAAALHVSKTSRGCVKPGSTFIILDAGGGTVDLTAHKVQASEGGKLTFVELAPGTGESCGSTFIDDHFLKFYRERIGPQAYDKIHQTNGSEIMSVLKEWEPIKRCFKGAQAMSSNECEKVALSLAVSRAIDEATLRKLAEEQSGFDDAVFLTGSDIQKFFDPVVDKVLLLTEEMRLRCPEQKVDMIICVGGFAESHYLLRKVREKYNAMNIEVVCPADPGATVVKGAVTFGLDPDAIAARCARWTYGLAVRGFWDDSFPENRRTWDSYQRTWMVEDKFDKLVTVGEEISSEYEVSRTYYPPSCYSRSIRVSLHASTSPSPKFVNDEGCFRMAEINVPIAVNPSSNVSDYPIRVFVLFGTSEISVRAVNERNGEQFCCNVNYDTSKLENQSDKTTTNNSSSSTSNDSHQQNANNAAATGRQGSPPGSRGKNGSPGNPTRAGSPHQDADGVDSGSRVRQRNSAAGSTFSPPVRRSRN